MIILQLAREEKASSDILKDFADVLDVGEKVDDVGDEEGEEDEEGR